MRVVLLGLCLCLSLVGCFSAEPDGGALIACSSEAECPKPLQCVPERGACFTVEQISGRVCGDGFRASSDVEECDDGAANNDDIPDACRTDCTKARCGDGVIDSTETCDDGNNADGDSCPEGCQQAFCGDSILAPQEVCDDGNLDSGDGCRGDCQKTEACGDAITDAAEDCDDGNANPADGCDACRTVIWSPRVVTGRGAEGGLAKTTALRDPTDITVAPDGSVFIVDAGQFRILRVDAAGQVSVVAGTGEQGLDGDGGLAINARLDSPDSIVVDGRGRVFFVDDNHQRVRVIDVDGTIQAFAGDPDAPTGSGNDGPATVAGFGEIADLAIDGLGDVLILDLVHGSIRRVDRAGVVNRFVGPGSSTFDGVPLTDLFLRNPDELTVGIDGTLYVSTPGIGRMWRIADGEPFFFAGAGGDTPRDGASARDVFLEAFSIAADATSQWALDRESVLWRIVDGTLHRVGGGGAVDPVLAPDIQQADFFGVERMAATPAGELLMVEPRKHRVLRLTVDGTISVFAGTGAVGFVGVGSPATRAVLQELGKASRDTLGRLLVADRDTALVYRVELDGTLAVAAGGGLLNGPAPQALDLGLFLPDGVAADHDGGFYVSDGFVEVIYHVDNEGQASIAVGEFGVGINEGGALGDGGPAVDAHVDSVRDLVVDPEGRLVFADSNTCRVRRVDAAGIITTIVGNGACGDAGDGGQALQASLSPVSVAVAADGRILLGTDDDTIREVGVDGIIRTLAGNGGTFRADGLLASQTFGFFSSPVAYDASGARIIADGIDLFTIDSGGRLRSLSGGNGARLIGDGGPVALADLGSCDGLQAAGTDLLYTDVRRGRIRVIDVDRNVRTALGDSRRVDVGPVEQASLPLARAAVALDDGAVLVAGGVGRLLLVHDDVVEVVAGLVDGNPIGAVTPTAAVFAQELADVGGLVRVGDTVWIAETGRDRLLELAIAGDPSTWTLRVLGGGVAGHLDGALAQARFRGPMGLSASPDGTAVVVADRDNQVVRRVDVASGVVTTVAGLRGVRGFTGDDGPAIRAALSDPEATAVGTDGAIFVADTGNHRLRRVGPDGVITTILGDGTPSSSGDGAPARTLPIEGPRGLTVDAFGNLIATTPTIVRLLAADADGVVDGSGAVQTIYGRAPRTGDPEAVTRCLGGVTVPTDVDDRIMMVDTCVGFLVELTRQ